MLKRAVTDLPNVSLDEVHNRWEMSSPTSPVGINIDQKTVPTIRNSDRGVVRHREASVIEDEFQDCIEWNSIVREPESDIRHNVRRQEPVAPPPEPERPSIPNNLPGSLKRTAPVIERIEKREEPHTLPKQNEGFTYVKDPNENIFGVKLRHVPRRSIPNAESENVEDPESGAYAVSPVPGIGPDVGPRDSINFPLGQPANRHASISHSVGNDAPSEPEPNPPPVPPPDPLLNNLNHKKYGSLNAQMSLEEAIRTRRPLRPVHRPTIDTTC